MNDAYYGVKEWIKNSSRISGIFTVKGSSTKKQAKKHLSKENLFSNLWLYPFFPSSSRVTSIQSNPVYINAKLI